MKRLFLFLLFGFYVGCTPAGVVTVTQPPKPAAIVSIQSEQPQFSEVSVNLSAGGLPFGIEKLDFRVREVRFKNADNEWVTFRSNAGLLSLRSDNQNFTLLSDIKLSVDEWKSVGIVIDQVYAHYNKSAGGPLNVSQNELLVINKSFDVSVDGVTAINLTLDTSSSIWRDDTGRWFFVPVVSVD